MFPFFSRMFPSTNLQDLNLDWICRRIMELSKGIIAPWINPDSKRWMVYDTATEQFVDSGVSATGTVNREWDVDSNGKMLFIGNSYGNEGTAWLKWPAIAADTLHLGEEGVGWWNLCVPGASMTGTPSFISALNDWIDNHLDELVNIGAVVIAAGVNDAHAAGVAALPAAMDELTTRIKNTMPRAIVYYGYSGFVDRSNNVHSHPATDAYMARVMEIYQSCPQYGALYLNGVESIIHSKTQLYDGVHPNEAAAKELGRGIAQAIQTGSVDVYRHTTVGASSPLYGSVEQAQSGNIAVSNFNIGAVYPEGSRPVWEVGQLINIGVLNLPYQNGMELFSALLTVYAMESGIITVTAQLAIDPETNILKARIGSFSTGASSATIANIVQFSITCANAIYHENYTSM